MSQAAHRQLQRETGALPLRQSIARPIRARPGAEVQQLGISSFSLTTPANNTLLAATISPADCALGEPADLGDLWAALTAGIYQVVSAFSTDERFGVMVRAVRAAADQNDTSRKLTVLKCLLRGEPQKLPAAELGLTVSTIALDAKKCLSFMGFACTASRIPPLLFMAANARVSSEAVDARVFCASDGCRVFSAARLDRRLSALMAPAECAVARLLVEGKSHAEIATVRGTSRRTVANQIAAVFRRTHVSGRCQLIHWLIDALDCESNGF
jgi:DNA-binding NarL/FixJ family response regulator